MTKLGPGLKHGPMKDVFDAAKHPRRRDGRFRAVTMNLKTGQLEYEDRDYGETRQAALINRIQLMPVGGTIEVPGAPLITHTERDGVSIGRHRSIGISAAPKALNMSARSSHPDSIGGTRKYTSLKHFEQREQKVEKQRANIAKSRAGQKS